MGFVPDGVAVHLKQARSRGSVQSFKGRKRKHHMVFPLVKKGRNRRLEDNSRRKRTKAAQNRRESNIYEEVIHLIGMIKDIS